MEEKILISNKTKGKLASLPFAKLKDDILGKNYSLSIAFVGTKKSRDLNHRFRKKDYPTNILSFSLSKNSGELILCPQIIKKEAVNFGRTVRGFTGYLVIHGMLHLKGRTHGRIMEVEEKKYDQKYFNRNRYRNLVDESRSGRTRKRRKIS